MEKRKILAPFEKRNMPDSTDPRFDIVSQENEIVTMNYGGHALALITGSGKPSDSFWTATKSGMRFLNLIAK
jgi:hypothetical protein